MVPSSLSLPHPPSESCTTLAPLTHQLATPVKITLYKSTFSYLLKYFKQHFLSPLTCHQVTCYSHLETEMGFKNVFLFFLFLDATL